MEELPLTGEDEDNQCHYRPPVFDAICVQYIVHLIPSRSNLVVSMLPVSRSGHKSSSKISLISHGLLSFLVERKDCEV